MALAPRFLLAFFVIVASLAAAMPVSAEHGDEVEHSCTDEAFFHLCLDIQTLGPGEEKRRQLISPEGPLRQGWIYIIYGGVVEGNGSLAAELHGPQGLTEAFDWSPGLHRDVTKIQATGNHTLVISNPTNGTLKYAFYYDQSCNCAGKVIPLPNGFVLFNYEFKAGQRVSLQYPLTDAWRVTGHLAMHDPASPTAEWPEDFTVIESVQGTAPGWLNFSFVPPERAIYYVLVEDRASAKPDAPIQLSPIIDVEKQEESPAAPFALVLVLAAFVAVLRRRVTS